MTFIEAKTRLECPQPSQVAATERAFRQSQPGNPAFPGPFAVIAAGEMWKVEPSAHTPSRDAPRTTLKRPAFAGMVKTHSFVAAAPSWHSLPAQRQDQVNALQDQVIDLLVILNRSVLQLPQQCRLDPQRCAHPLIGQSLRSGRDLPGHQRGGTMLRGVCPGGVGSGLGAGSPGAPCRIIPPP